MVLRFKCSECGKIIEEVSEGRFKYNVEQHELKHKRKKEKESKTK